MIVAMPAAAQEAPQAPRAKAKSVFDGDYLIVGVGIMSAPDYEGSNDSSIGPAVGATGEVAGIGFTIRGPGLSLDLIPDRKGANVRLRFGPQIRLSTNRHGDVKDDVVASLGKLDNVIEAGFRAGVSFDNFLSRKASLSTGVSVRWDISGKGSGMIVTPSATYRLPVSRGQAFGLLASAKFSNGKYADYNYGVTPAGAAASGLPVFDGKSGLQDVSVGLATAHDLNGNFLDGGFAIGAGVLYSRLFGSAARTPITSIRGSRDQWVVGGGVTYTF